MNKAIKKRWRDELSFILLASGKGNKVPRLIEFMEAEVKEAIRMDRLQANILEDK